MFVWFTPSLSQQPTWMLWPTHGHFHNFNLLRQWVSWPANPLRHSRLSLPAETSPAPASYTGMINIELVDQRLNIVVEIQKLLNFFPLCINMVLSSVLNFFIVVIYYTRKLANVFKSRGGPVEFIHQPSFPTTRTFHPPRSASRSSGLSR